MRKITTNLLLILLFSFVSSCDTSDDDACSPAILEITSLENEYGCVNTPYQVDIDLSEEFIIIRSQDIFNNLVTGSCMPEIDFTTFDLLVGKKGLVSGFDTIDYDGLVKSCNDNTWSLTVTFVLNAAAEAPNATYHVLMPKAAGDEGVIVAVLTI